jgi:hypothetical protein
MSLQWYLDNIILRLQVLEDRVEEWYKDDKDVQDHQDCCQHESFLLTVLTQNVLEPA